MPNEINRPTLRVAVVAGLLVAATMALADHPRAKEDEPGGVRPDGRIAPILENLGDLHHPVTTSSAEAQQFFDQGLRLCYAFNHEEAVRAFREAARLDPDCAMAYWGHALALGPNINAPMSREAEIAAYDVLQKAVALKPKVSQKERDYIDALTTRYSKEDDADRAALDLAYANAMRELARRYPDDLDAATLLAEAMMDLQPWDYWTRDGKPRAITPEIVATLESIIERDPNHPGALHFYIHAVEASQTPERAEAAADRLLTLMPGAGHLVHMPAHIYIRIGRYADSAEANRLAIKADDEYITQCRVQGLYPLAYHPHNIHFLWASATLEGNSGEALSAAELLATKVHQEMLGDPEFGIADHFYVTPLLAMVRFGKWDEILDQPAPDSSQRFPTAIWHYARGMALAAKDRRADAEAELSQLQIIADDGSLDEVSIFGGNSLGHVLRIAQEVLAGELAARRDDYDQAIAHLERGVRLDDALRYNEPHDWHQPVRHNLGAVLLEAGYPAEAEVVYWEDLRRNPENGWALFGLKQSLEAQGNDEEAARVEKRFQAAWRNADVELTGSRFK